MQVLITGANGFIGKNIRLHLDLRDDLSYRCFTRGMDHSQLLEMVAQSDFVFHLAGVNRPENESAFMQGNAQLTQQLCEVIQTSGRNIPVLYTSSIQADMDNAYGRSKLAAEEILFDYANKSGMKFYNFRLPNVFGKWAKPDYNSAVATFCYRTVHEQPISIHDANATIRLVYIDDVIACMMEALSGTVADGMCVVQPEYTITVGALADKLAQFKTSRNTHMTAPVGKGLDRALHATYLSYLSPENFSYDLPKHVDSRGLFVEMLKTGDSGQFSYFTAHPGVTRGGHYHHTKTEKFLVVHGEARFRFRHMLTEESYALKTCGDEPKVVETVPGWAHDITNIGKDEMIVLLWANECFDPDQSDTYESPL